MVEAWELVELRPVVCGVLHGQQALIVEHRAGAMRREPRRRPQIDPAFDRRQMRRDTLGDRQGRIVEADPPVFGMIDDEGNLLLEQARVNRVQHRTDARIRRRTTRNDDACSRRAIPRDRRSARPAPAAPWPGAWPAPAPRRRCSDAAPPSMVRDTISVAPCVAAACSMMPDISSGISMIRPRISITAWRRRGGSRRPGTRTSRRQTGRAAWRGRRDSRRANW